MSDETSAPKKRFPLGRIVLVLSLALNLLIAGLVVGAVINGGGFARGGNDIGPDNRRGALREIGNAPFVRAFTRDEQLALNDALRDEGPSLRQNRRLLRQRVRALLDALRATPFDETAVQTLFESQREAALDHQRLGQRLILERLSAMTDAERAAYADRLDKTLRSGPRPRQSGPRKTP